MNTWTAPPPFLPPKNGRRREVAVSVGSTVVSFLTLREYSVFFHFTKLLLYHLLHGPPYSSSRIEMCDLQPRGMIRT